MYIKLLDRRFTGRLLQKMKILFKILLGSVIIGTLFFNALPCGAPSLYPLFSYTRAPENPYENFAAGRIGIVKPTLKRSVLFAAFRYINGGSFSADEQKALVEVWNADFNNKDFRDVSIDDAVKLWVAKRKDVMADEKKLPEIYVQREYDGYSFFPNCTRSSFETAVQTLNDRIASNSTNDKNVKNWVEAQDAVFQNCASGEIVPSDAPAGSPDWLIKDRNYQQAAAAFYALKYDEAKSRFLSISEDSDSPWQDIAAYLVARTLIRQASLTSNKNSSDDLYKEAETRLAVFASHTNKYSESVEGMRSLIAYRVRPQERVQELAQLLSYQGSGNELRQRLIDYTWLLDKFESETLEAVDKEKKKNSNTNSEQASNDTDSDDDSDPNKLLLYVWSEENSESIKFNIPANSSDDDAISAAETAAGKKLSEKDKEAVREARKNAYADRFSKGRSTGYENSYYGSETTSLSILPQYLRLNELSDWLFTYQLTDQESYLHALNKYRSSRSDLWLMTAIIKSKKSSANVAELIEGAERLSSSSAAYPTVAYYLAKIYIENGETDKARTLLDGILRSTGDLPISTVNEFMELRQTINSSMDEYLRYSLRKPFAFDYDYISGSIDQIIAEQKSYYSAQYDGPDRARFEANVDESFAAEKLWQDRLFISERTIAEINHNFPTSLLVDLRGSEVLPDYLKQKIAFAAFTRSVLLDDPALIKRSAPDVIAAMPELKAKIEPILNAPAAAARRNEILYFLITDPMFSPYLDSGIGKVKNEYEEYGELNWWCEQYDSYYDTETEESIPVSSFKKPSFLTAQQIAASEMENKKLAETGSAPAYLANRTIALARTGLKDKRIAEMLYYAYISNTWNKYGCGGDAEITAAALSLLQTKFPSSEWTRKAENWQKDQ